MQIKLLRVLQEGEILPVGATAGRRIDVRVISASNVNPGRRRSRADASARISTTRLAAFPIRTCRGWSSGAATSLRWSTTCCTARWSTASKQVLGISPEARALLIECDWPGNVRQLKNEVERAVALAQPGDGIDLGDLSELVRNAVAPAGPALDAIDDRRGPPARSTRHRSRRASRVRVAVHLRRARPRGAATCRVPRPCSASRASCCTKKLKQLGLR